MQVLIPFYETRGDSIFSSFAPIEVPEHSVTRVASFTDKPVQFNHMDGALYQTLSDMHLLDELESDTPYVTRDVIEKHNDVVETGFSYIKRNGSGGIFALDKSQNINRNFHRHNDYGVVLPRKEVNDLKIVPHDDERVAGALETLKSTASRLRIGDGILHIRSAGPRVNIRKLDRRRGLSPIAVNLGINGRFEWPGSAFNFHDLQEIISLLRDEGLSEVPSDEEIQKIADQVKIDRPELIEDRTNLEVHNIAWYMVHMIGRSTLDDLSRSDLGGYTLLLRELIDAAKKKNVPYDDGISILPINSSPYDAHDVDHEDTLNIRNLMRNLHPVYQDIISSNKSFDILSIAFSVGPMSPHRDIDDLNNLVL